MEVKFGKEYLRELYENGTTSDKKHHYQPQVIKGYLKCVIALDEATRIEDLFRSNSLNYKKLSGDKKGLSSLRINKQYRLEFMEIANPEKESVVEICSLVDITNHYK
jgi:proteic killer suppression protein